MEGVRFFNLPEMPNLIGLSEMENLENGKQIVRTMHSIQSFNLPFTDWTAFHLTRII